MRNLLLAVVGVLPFAGMAVKAASLGPSVIAAGAARLDNGSLVTLGQPFVVMAGSGTGVAPGFYPAVQITSEAQPPFSIAPLGSWSPNGFSISLSGQANRDYVLLASSNLVQWTPIRTNRPVGESVILEDSAAGQFPCRFYRVRTL